MNKLTKTFVLPWVVKVDHLVGVVVLGGTHYFILLYAEGNLNE
jgi:hypothetical protein